MQTTTPLLPHQQTAVAKMLPTRAGALFMDIGTGKSRTTIELAKVRQEKYDLLFWFCPVSLKETIRQEWRKHSDLSDEEVKVWDEKVSCDQLPTCPYCWY
jgi:predicted helicase